IWLFLHEIRGISILDMRDYSALMLTSQILRRGWLGYTGGSTGMLRDGLCLLVESGGGLTDLDTAGALQFQLGGIRRRISWREFILALGLHTAEEMQTIGFGTYWAESARNPILRLSHRLIACSIAGRSQAPEKVTVTDLFYLRGMDICEEIDDTWAWVALGPERQPDAAAGAPRAVEDAHVVDKGDQAILAPVQAPPLPPAATNTMPQRMARLEEDMHKIRGALAEQREVIGAMARDFSRFIVWAASGITQLLESTRVTYTPYSETHIPYQRCVRRRTDGASTSTAQQDQQQHNL
ncbi:hypothetical protein Tco_1021870, partial [Tanacetum coccineum]